MMSSVPFFVFGLEIVVSSPALLRTPLYDSHARLNAKLVDFGGWEMPLHYGSQIDEHHSVRKHVGLFDVSHMLAVDLRGKDATAFLQTLLANNIGKLKSHGRALYSCMLNANGGVVDDLIVYHFDTEHFRLVVNASTAEKDLAWMESVRATRPFNIALTPRRDVSMIAVQGPQARARAWQAMPQTEAATRELKPFHSAMVGDVLMARTGYTGEDGFEITVPSSEAAALWQRLLDAGAKPCGLGARDTLRLEAGMNLYGQDMSDTTSPLESGLGWTVDLATPRDFIGRAALEAHPPKQQLIGLVLEGAGVLRAHQKIITPHGDGEITSGTFSPTLAKSIAFARIPAACVVGERVQAEVRGKLVDCRVVKLPFVRNGAAVITLPATS
jgi:aminomethyltransferase